MGKSNRIRTKRAEEVVKAPTVQKKVKKEAPSWLYSLLLIVVAIGVIIGVAATFISSSGMARRNTVALKSENYEIDAAMLQYLVRETYQTFLTNNETNLTYFSLDTSKDLRDQKYGDTTATSALETSMLGAFDGTWFEYFVSKANEQASEVLIYCEEADKRGIYLEDEDYASVDATITNIETMVMYYNMLGYNYTVDSYIAMVYGKGIKEKDIRNYLELYTRATKCAGIVGEELTDAITLDRINAEYDANVLDYSVVDYDQYSVRVEYKAVVEELFGKDATLSPEDEQKAFEAYKARIDEARAFIADLVATTDVEEFEAKLLLDLANKEFDASYKTEALAKADAPTEEAVAAIKAALVEKVFDDIANELDAPSDDTAESGDSFTAYSETLTKNAATAVDNIKKDVFDAVVAAKKNNIRTKVTYTAGNEISEWAFSSAAGTTKTTEVGDLNNVEGNITNEKGYYDTTVYLMKKAAYRDDEVSKKVGYLMFSKIEDAAKAIISLDGTVTEESFLAAGTENAAVASEVIDNYLRGDFGIEAIDNWLYDSETAKGSITDEPIQLSATEGSESWGVFFYIDDAEEAWNLAVKSAIYAEDADAKYIELMETYKVDFDITCLDKISA